MALQLFARKESRKSKIRKRPPVRRPEPFEPAPAIELESDPLKLCIQLGRYGHIVTRRDEWKDHPDLERYFIEACNTIDERFAMVPEGFVGLPLMVYDEPGCPEQTVETAPFLLSRCAVTNAEFQNFVDAGGYADLSLWPEEIWPHLIDFKDLTEEPGPRFWQKGRHNKPLADHPVVGICYYEAAAYVKWAGLRLPTEAEWQMAASWRIRSAANVLRRYPWGDALDIQRCNIWGSRHGTTVPVHEYENGAAPNHVLQLIGNVWEWTAGGFNVTDEEGNEIVGDMQMSTIRGGAFDTYFPVQATSVFRTGLVSLARVHNVGFRCAFDTRN